MALPGLVAVIASLFLGVTWWGPVVGGVAYTLAVWTPRRLGAPLLLAAPLVLASALPLDTAYSPVALLHVPVAILATLPFFLLTGNSLPWRTVPWYVGVVAVFLVFAYALAPGDVGLVLTHSDITARAQALVVLVGVVVAELGLWYRRRATPRAPSD